jgi:hypothetical protein
VIVSGHGDGGDCAVLEGEETEHLPATVDSSMNVLRQRSRGAAFAFTARRVVAESSASGMTASFSTAACPIRPCVRGNEPGGCARR